MSRNPWAITDGRSSCCSVGINWRRRPRQGNWLPREIAWLNSEVWDFHRSDMAWWGRRPRSLSSWHRGHCLSAKSSFLRPTSPPILCYTLNRPLILTRSTPYHPGQHAYSVCTETEKKGYLISSSSCTAPVYLVVGSQVCTGVWANQNFMSKPPSSVPYRLLLPPPK